MRKNFEVVSSSLFEVDPYHRSSHSANRDADVSPIDFKATRVSSEVDLRWYPREYFLKLTQNQKEEL